MSVLTSIANEIAPSDIGVDSSQDCSYNLDRVLVDFDSGRVVLG